MNDNLMRELRELTQGEKDRSFWQILLWNSKQEMQHILTIGVG